ncbi:hypothetical protein Fmac_032722 [Flemingia macrophylla]|uniref:RRM domain-containing protein n=1 Tax=Flemingia macrophylla TaxID=520843 RepID=A0ABD1L5Q8_9FABA
MGQLQNTTERELERLRRSNVDVSDRIDGLEKRRRRQQETSGSSNGRACYTLETLDRPLPLSRVSLPKFFSLHLCCPISRVSSRRLLWQFPSSSSSSSSFGGGFHHFGIKSFGSSLGKQRLKFKVGTSITLVWIEKGQTPKELEASKKTFSDLLTDLLRKFPSFLLKIPALILCILPILTLKSLSHRIQTRASATSRAFGYVSPSFLFEGVGDGEEVEMDGRGGGVKDGGFVSMSFMIRPLGGAGGLGLSPCLRWRKLKRRLSSSMAISRGGGGFSDSENRVHVGNLAWGVDNLALESLFREQQKVLEARVIYNRESGRSRGFGFVTYNSSDEVNSAI